MTQIERLAVAPPETILARLDRGLAATFESGRCRAGLLPAGATVYRYGASCAQVESRQSPGRTWVFLTEARYQYSEDAVRACSLLDMTVADHGERDPVTGRIIGGTITPQTWNTAAFRGEFRTERDVYVWAGVAAPVAFDRRQGVQVSRPGHEVHATTPGGASQILLQARDIDALRLIKPPVALARVRLLH